MTWRGAFAGALMLIALEAVVRTPQGAGRVGSALEGIGDIVRRVMSPAVPLIPDTRTNNGLPDGADFGDFEPKGFSLDGFG